MALDLGTLLLGVGGVLGPILGANAANDANRANTAAANNQIAFQKDILNSGQVDAFGNLINARPGGTGPFTTELFGDTKGLADTGLANALQGEQTRGGFGEAGSSLLQQFLRGVGPAREPLSLEGATGVINADNDRLKNAILNPALDDINALAQRTRGGMSNQSNLVRDFMARILPQIKLGGEREALDLQAADRNRFTQETLGLGEGALKVASGGFQPTIPGVANLGQISNAVNSISGPPQQQPNFLGSSIAAGAANVGNLLTGIKQQQQGQDNYSALLKVLSDRGLGNQGSFGRIGPSGGI